MARNKRYLEQKVKIEEIELVAMALMKEKGYDNTSMAEIARGAGVAANTIYWYFENKDDVLLAVLNRVVSSAITRAMALEDQPLSSRALFLIEQVKSSGALMTDVHARVAHSAKVRAWHDRFHSLVEHMVVSALVKTGVEPVEAQCDARVLIYVIEGLLAHPHPLEDREQIINHALTRLTGQRPV